MDISIKLGKEGEEQHKALVTIEACSCRLDDFVMALVGFANEWKREADRNESNTSAAEAARAEARSGGALNPQRANQKKVVRKPCTKCPDKEG